MRIVHLLRHNHNCSLDTNTIVTKLGRHIGVMMVRSVIPHIAGIVVGYWRNGCSYRNIAREVDLHSNTVYGIIKRFRERGNFVSGRCTRRSRKTNDRDDRVLYRLYRENWRSSVHRLRRAWQPDVNFAVSRQTVNRRQVARAYRAMRMVKVPRLTVRAKLVRRHWAQTHISRSLGQWQHVIFCDESRFMLFRIDNRIRVRRLVIEAMNEDCTHGNMSHGGGSVYVWGGILVRSGSDVTGTVYGGVQEEHLVIHGRAWYRNNWLLADENARPHRACVVDAYLHEQGVIHVDWAPYCPDMNSIELIWDEIGRGLEELDPQAVNLSCSPKFMATDPSWESRPWIVACHAESVL